MIDYQQGKIYKIECNVTGKVYIGSTCEPILARRLAGHIKNYKRYLNGKSNYVSSFDVLQNGNYDIVLIESYPCNSKDELHARERYHTNNIGCVNKIKNQGMKNELGEKEYRKQHDKNYREKNKNIIHAKQKEKHICICGNCYTHINKQRHIRSVKHQQYLYYLKHKTIIDGLNMIKALDIYFNAI
jgi:hypothetical protein